MQENVENEPICTVNVGRSWDLIKVFLNNAYNI